MLVAVNHHSPSALSRCLRLRVPRSTCVRKREGNCYGKGFRVSCGGDRGLDMLACATGSGYQRLVAAVTFTSDVALAAGGAQRVLGQKSVGDVCRIAA